MKIVAGEKYENGFGAIIKVISAPTAKNAWFEDEMGNRYHETGEMVRMSSRPEYNLVGTCHDLISTTCRQYSNS